MPASAPLVPVRPAPRSLKPSPGPLEIFADGLAIEIRRDDRVLYDSPLEEAGFEPSVPLCPHPGLIGSFVGDRGSWRSGCRDALWLYRGAGPGEWRQAYAVRAVQFAVPRRQCEDPARLLERGAVPRPRRLPRSRP